MHTSDFDKKVLTPISLSNSGRSNFSRIMAFHGINSIKHDIDFNPKKIDIFKLHTIFIA